METFGFQGEEESQEQDRRPFAGVHLDPALIQTLVAPPTSRTHNLLSDDDILFQEIEARARDLAAKQLQDAAIEDKLLSELAFECELLTSRLRMVKFLNQS